MADKQTTHQVTEVNKDGSGTINFPEFLGKNGTDVQEAFRLYDIDGNGYVTALELR